MARSIIVQLRDGAHDAALAACAVFTAAGLAGFLVAAL